jgi:hypothetical protein
MAREGLPDVTRDMGMAGGGAIGIALARHLP